MWALFISTSFIEALHFPAEFTMQVMNYPNIVTQREKCLPARGLNQLHKTLVCDPREILTPNEVKLLNRQLLDLQASLNSDKKACDEAYPRPTIAVALERRMQLGSTNGELIDYAAVYSYYLLESWKLQGHCKSKLDRIIIFYSADDGVLYTMAGEYIRHRLPIEDIRRVAVESSALFRSSIYEGLLYVITQYRKILSSGRGALYEGN
ncbi:hypothetical protein SprV_0501762800 [Sparganum proliferum]